MGTTCGATPVLQYHLQTGGGPRGMQCHLQTGGGSRSMQYHLQTSGGPRGMQYHLQTGGGPCSMQHHLQTSGGPRSMQHHLQTSGGPRSMQHHLQTSGGPRSMQHHLQTSGGPRSSATTCVHPLVPLLLCTRRLLPRCSSSTYDRPITASAAPGTQPGYHGDGVSRAAVKKPLNAFMLYMKETRQRVVQEGRERQSAAINRILGRRWNALSAAEQSKYFDLAQKERLLHMQLHPGWSARDNYGKRKKKQQKTTGSVFRSVW